MWPFRRGETIPNNEQFVNTPVYGADPLGSAMVHALDYAHSLTYGYQLNNPQPAWKPSGERERKSSYDLGPLQNFQGGAMVNKVLARQFHLQRLGLAQPQIMTETEAMVASAMQFRLGTPGDVTRPTATRVPTRAG